MSDPASTSEQPQAGQPTLSAAELKKKKNEEKKARRAAQLEQRDGATFIPPAVNGESSTAQQGEHGAQVQKKGADRQTKGQQQKQVKGSGQPSESGHNRTPSQQQAIPLRRRPSQTQATSKPVIKKDKKEVELFSHLYQTRRQTLEGVPKAVHRAVQTLGVQIGSYEICGSNARCVGMLEAFKEAILDYSTPAGTSLTRDLMPHYLSPQIDFLKSCRPISESMGNAIRWLKKLIFEMDPSTPEQEAKTELCNKIDTFIRDRIVFSDQLIAESASRRIKHNSVVLTFAKSSIVEKTILQAHESGTQFRVVIVDSRPLFEGKSLATSLMYAGLEVEYLPFSAISHAVKQASLVLLGAHSMLSNGGLRSRIGTAAIAMQAAKADLPVIVCCESIKFSDKSALDSIAVNEVAPAEELFLAKPQSASDQSDAEKTKSLDDWKEIANLQILNLMYDVTPAENIRMVICERGSIPPSAVAQVHRMANEGD